MALSDDMLEEYGALVDKAKDYVSNYNPDETVNYNDQRFLDVKSEQQKQEELINKNYDEMINSSDKFYQDQINASKEYAQKQTELQQQNTDFAIEKINQEKEQAQKDYKKEQRGSYVDYQKQANQYGTNAEQMAVAGLKNAGYSESSLVSMYNTYQNRVATARESLNRAILNFNNSITEAQLANNSKIAEITFNALQQQLELSLQGFQYKNSLIEAKENQITANNDRYYNRYQNVLAQINQEIANRQNLYNQYSGILQSHNNLMEEIRQFNTEMDEKKAQREESRRQWEAEFAEKQRQFDREYALEQQKLAETKASRLAAQQQQLQVQDSTSKRNSKSYTPQEILQNVKIIQGVGLKNNVKDGFSGKTFASIDELLAYYGYASVD